MSKIILALTTGMLESGPDFKRKDVELSSVEINTQQKYAVLFFEPDQYRLAIDTMRRIKSGWYLSIDYCGWRVYPSQCTKIDLYTDPLTHRPFITINCSRMASTPISISTKVQQAPSKDFVLKIYWLAQDTRPIWNEDLILKKALSFSHYVSVHGIGDCTLAEYTKESILAALEYLPKEYLSSGYVTIYKNKAGHEL